MSARIGTAIDRGIASLVATAATMSGGSTRPSASTALIARFPAVTDDHLHDRSINSAVDECKIARIF
jgi:hypothetical protein